MTPKPHQIEKSLLCWNILRQKGYVYLAGKPRSGKTLTSMITAEHSTKIKEVIILTTKNAIGYPKKLNPDGTTATDAKGKEVLVTNRNSKHYDEDREEGWLNTIKKYKSSIKFTVINYEQLGTIDNSKKIILKLDPSKYQLAIIDESHNLGTIGKPSSRVKIIKKFCEHLPHIHLSGTAIVESPCSIYHQMSISKFKPFKEKNFYEFHSRYGKPYTIKVSGRPVTKYDRADKDKLMPIIDSFTVYMTQEDAGISKDLQAKDKLHYVELNKHTKAFYNILQEDGVAKVDENMFDYKTSDGKITGKPKMMLFCDTEMKLRTSLHMLESGILKLEKDYIFLGNTEKIDYIRRTFGDSKDIGIMCHFVGERALLKTKFRHANIYSSTSHAEGVDLSHLRYFIILSSGYSGSKFIQRRDRIININGSSTLTVHHILVKNAISEQVYKKVSKKEDFNNSTYERKTI